MNSNLGSRVYNKHLAHLLFKLFNKCYPYGWRGRVLQRLNTLPNSPSQIMPEQGNRPDTMGRFCSLPEVQHTQIPSLVWPLVGVGHKKNLHEIWKVEVKQQLLCSEDGHTGARHHDSVNLHVITDLLGVGQWCGAMAGSHSFSSFQQISSFQLFESCAMAGILCSFMAKDTSLFCKLSILLRLEAMRYRCGFVCLLSLCSCPACLPNCQSSRPLVTSRLLPDAEATASHRLLYKFPQWRWV